MIHVGFEPTSMRTVYIIIYIFTIYMINDLTIYSIEDNIIYHHKLVVYTISQLTNFEIQMCI